MYKVLLAFLMITFIIGFKNTYGQQLQASNAIKTESKEKSMPIPKLEAPKDIGQIRLKIDSTDNYDKDRNHKAKEDSLNAELSKAVMEKAIKFREAQDAFNELTSLKKKQKKLTEVQKEQLEKYNKLVASLGKSLDSLTVVAKKSQDDISQKNSEIRAQISKKNAYRSEYYAKLISEANENMEILNKNYLDYKQELLRNKDSLAPSKWPLYGSNKDTMVREMAYLFSDLLVSTSTMLANLEKLISDYPALEKKLNELKEVEVVRTLGEASDGFIDSLFMKRKEELKAAFSQEKIHNDAFKKEYDSYRDKFRGYIIEINEIKKNHKPKEEEKQSSDASVLANFTQPLNQSTSLIPGIDIFAYKKFDSDEYSFYGQAKLFLAAPGSDTNSLSHATKYFIPEASQFGFMADFSFGFLPAKAVPDKNAEKKLGLNFSFYYLQKQLSTRDSLKTLFSTGMVQVKSGLEFILIKNALSVYANLNGYLVGKGVEGYNKFYVNDSKFKWFSEFGLKSYLVLQSDSKINLLLDLRFLPVGRTIKEMTLSKDKFIPLFKLGIVKEFDF